MLPPEDFSITVGHHRDTATVVVAGELDLATAPRLREHLEALAQTGPAAIVLDLGGLTFMDSTGVSLLLATWRGAERRGVRLSLTRVPDDVLRLLELCGVAALLPIAGGRAPGAPDARGATHRS
jgi:anti-sigma B factor antagonist